MFENNSIVVNVQTVFENNSIFVKYWQYLRDQYIRQVLTVFKSNDNIWEYMQNEDYLHLNTIKVRSDPDIVDPDKVFDMLYMICRRQESS